MSSEEDQHKFEDSYKRNTTITLIVVAVALIVVYALIRAYK